MFSMGNGHPGQAVAESAQHREPPMTRVWIELVRQGVRHVDSDAVKKRISHMVIMGGRPEKGRMLQ